ncbi:MAG: NAD(P)/FAD-dependent oxidoreductase [Anaerolineae bacterium]
MIEPNPIGRVQTSACGTLLAVLEATGTMDSLLQVHDRFVLHLPGRTFDVPTTYPFCTFNFEVFCHRLLAQSDAEVIRAAVLGCREHVVQTSRGDFEAEVLIDASGWRAVLATGGEQQRQIHRGKSFGLETAVPVQESGLHFWYQPERLLAKGVTWLFPIGPVSRMGIGSYLGDTRLKNDLVSWLHSDFSLSPDGIHGGYFPYRRHQAVTGHVFRVGDAAGQCLPLTGEGIRPALYFGAQAGRLARAVVDGQMSAETALKMYCRLVDKYTNVYRFLLLAQKFLTNIPVAWVEKLAIEIDERGFFPRFMRVYRRVIEPAVLSEMCVDFTAESAKIAETKRENFSHFAL